MAGNYNSMGRPEYGNVFQRVFDMDEAAAVSTLGHELQGVISPFERPEFWIHANVRMGSAGGQVAAGAGASTVRLRNPTNSGVVIVVEAVEISAATGTVGFTLVRSSATTDLGTLVTPVARDFRQTTPPGPSLVSTTNAAGPVGTIIAAASRDVNSGWAYTYPIVITPGLAIEVGTGAPNAIYFSLVWYERPMGSKELTIG